MNNLNTYIIEKLKINKDTKSDDIEGLKKLLDFLKPEFDKMDWPYITDIREYDILNTYYLYIEVNHKASKTTVNRICGEINGLLKHEKINYRCYYGIDTAKKTFHFSFTKYERN